MVKRVAGILNGVWVKVIFLLLLIVSLGRSAQVDYRSRQQIPFDRKAWIRAGRDPKGLDNPRFMMRRDAMRHVVIGSLARDLLKTFGTPTDVLTGASARTRFEMCSDVKFVEGACVYQYNLGMFFAVIEHTEWTHGLEIFVDSTGRVLDCGIDFV